MHPDATIIPRIVDDFVKPGGNLQPATRSCVRYVITDQMGVRCIDNFNRM